MKYTILGKSGLEVSGSPSAPGNSVETGVRRTRCRRPRPFAGPPTGASPCSTRPKAIDSASPNVFWPPPWVSCHVRRSSSPPKAACARLATVLCAMPAQRGYARAWNPAFALATDYIDLYQVHWPDPATPLAETAEALAKLVADGKIRHVGVSNFDVAQMEAFSATLPVETLQPPYHLFRRAIEAEVLPYTAAHDIGVLVYRPLAHGLLGGHLGPDTQFAPGDWRTRTWSPLLMALAGVELDPFLYFVEEASSTATF